MDEKTLNETLFELGAYCSGLGDETLQKFRGDLEGYRKLVKQGVSGDNITYDWDKGVITMASDERTDCFCPLISRLNHTPTVACNCSLGWQKHTWETLLQKKVRVELKESVLRGGNYLHPAEHHYIETVAGVVRFVDHATLGKLLYRFPRQVI